MRYEIILAPEAAEDLQAVKANVRYAVRDGIERRLSRPQYRLRIDDVRVFYDITETSVEILAIIPKSVAGAWLDMAGTPETEEE
jgi:mRNA interferase RelE/StbE